MTWDEDYNQQIALAIMPKFSAFASLIGSGFIMYDIVCSHFQISPTWCLKKKENNNGSAVPGGSSMGFNRSNRSGQGRNLATAPRRASMRFAVRKTLNNSAYYRLMLAMSTSDFIVSFAWFMTTWPIPADDQLEYENPSESVYGNIGTVDTCTVQGFFIQLGIITPFYNALLALYYYLTIKCEWKEDDFKCRIEYAGHAITITWGFGTAIAGIFMDLYNNSRVWCWISSYPAKCEGDDCERGANAAVMRWAFYYGPLWLMIFFVGFFMTLVYVYVRGLDRKMDQYTSEYSRAARAGVDSSAEFAGPGGRGGRGGRGPGGRRQQPASLLQRTISVMNTEAITEQRQQRRNKRSKAVASQGLFYAGTFALVWVFGTIARVMQLAGYSPPWTVWFWFAILTPSQGFFNFLVYIRPRMIKFWAERRKAREGRRRSRDSTSLHVSGISHHSSSNEVTKNDSNETDTSSPPPKIKFEIPDNLEFGECDSSKEQTVPRDESS